jgi:carboxymethylenebutenolidase
MELKREWITVGSGAAAVPVALARPAAVTGRLPAVVVIQEVWGVDAHILDITDRFAVAGYLAAAPDLYAHGGTRPKAVEPGRIGALKRFLDEAPPEVWRDPDAREQALAARPAAEAAALRETVGVVLTGERPLSRYAADLRAVVAALRSRPDCTGRVGCVGYCMGGHLSALVAGAEPDLGAAVIFYGACPAPEAMAGLRCPLLGLYGSEDPRITGGVEAFAAALTAAGRPFEHYVYRGAPHAFFNDTRPSYHAVAARAAWARTLGFFAEHLAPLS